MSIEQSKLDNFLNEEPGSLAPELVPEDAHAGDDRPVQVAGLVDTVARKVGGSTRAVVRDVLDPVLQEGARMIRNKTGKIPLDPSLPQTTPVAPTPGALQITITGSSTSPTPPPGPGNGAGRTIREASIPEMDAAVQGRQDRIYEGLASDAGMPVDPTLVPRGTPGEGKVFNLDVFDNDGLRATIDEVAQAAPDFGTKSIQSIYDDALASGIDANFVQQILSGQPMDAKVGNGTELSQTFAKTLYTFDASARRLDGMMEKAAAGQLDDAGKLELRKALALHGELSKAVKGMQVDVARSMNVFKRAAGGSAIDPTIQRQVLDELGSDAVLQQLAVDYMTLSTRSGKNAVLEKGLGAKSRDVWFYVYQSNLLNDPTTHFYNAAGNAVFGTLAPIERTAAAIIGKGRSLVGWGDADRYTAHDLYAHFTGISQGMRDGWVLLGKHAQQFKDDFSAIGKPSTPGVGQAPAHGGGFKADEMGSPLSSENFQSTKVGEFASKFWGSELRVTPLGRVIDGLGFIHSIPFRALGAADDFFASIAARYQMHGELWTYSNRLYDDLIAAGVSEQDAIKEVQRHGAEFLKRRPEEIDANIENFTKSITLQRDLEKGTALDNFYWSTNKVLALPPVKILVPFHKTLSNIFLEGASRVPILNAISPRWWELYNKGGRYRDEAMARLAVGSSAIVVAAMLGNEGKITGHGPLQKEDRAALEKQGWQQYSIRFNRGELSDADIQSLRKNGIPVTHNDQHIWVSYARLDPASMVIAMGANFADASRFTPWHKADDEMWQKVFANGAFAATDYLGNLPMNQAVGQIIRIASSRAEGEDKAADIIAHLGKTGGSFLFTGTPGVGLVNSTMAAHIERMIDPQRSQTMPTQPTMRDDYVSRAFYETWNQVMSRIPGVSKGVAAMHDGLGREIKVNTRAEDLYLNIVPVITAREGRYSEVDSILARYNYGIKEPSKAIDGVMMSAEQFERYKVLSGQEFTVDGANLEQAIVNAVTQMELDYLPNKPAVGDVQERIGAIVSSYRQVAKKMLFGDMENDPYDLQPVEYPEFRALARRNRDLMKTYGK